MKIAVDVTPHVGGGGLTYIYNLFTWLARIDQDNEYFIFARFGPGRLGLAQLPEDQFHFEIAPSWTRSFARRQLYTQIMLPTRLREMAVDVLFSPADVTSLLAPCPVVLAIRNSRPYFPGVLSPQRKLKLRLLKVATWLSAMKATRVFFPSHFALNRIAPQLGIPFGKTHVIYHGIDHGLFSPNGSVPTTMETELVKRVNCLKPYVLCVSTFNPHKNHETLLRAWSQLSGSHRSSYRLVMAGRNSSPAYFNRLQNLIRDLNIGSEVAFLGEIAYQSIPFVFRNATLAVSPSTLESFGHPLVEAMASGVPLVAADAACIPEITDGAALLFEPDSASDLACAITQMLDDEATRAKFRERGLKRARGFSWEHAACETLHILEQR